MHNPNTLPLLSPKKKTADIDGSRKSEEENSPTPVEAEVRRAGLERGGGGGGGEGVLWVKGWSEHTEYTPEINGG
jgi:hypothetical protein